MKKLQKINFKQCDVMSQKQLNTIRGGQSHKSVCNCDTDCCGPDIGYVITWDDGTTATGIICENERLDE